jgi:TonB family protein
MPALPGGGGTAAIESAIQRNYRYPVDAAKAGLSGRILVSFVVLETGFVDQVNVEKKLSPSADAAALQAVKALPLFRPGMRDGQKVAVRLTVPITWVNGGPPNPVGPSFTRTQVRKGSDDFERVELDGELMSALDKEGTQAYTYVDQMPQLPGGGGLGAIENAIQKVLIAPDNAETGIIFISFIVLPTGKMSELKLLKGLNESSNKAALAAAGKLPAFTPGKLKGSPVPVRYVVPVRMSPPNQPGKAR